MRVIGTEFASRITQNQIMNRTLFASLLGARDLRTQANIALEAHQSQVASNDIVLLIAYDL